MFGKKKKQDEEVKAAVAEEANTDAAPLEVEPPMPAEPEAPVVTRETEPPIPEDPGPAECQHTSVLEEGETRTCTNCEKQI
jgi:hypothetical protein